MRTLIIIISVFIGLICNGYAAPKLSDLNGYDYAQYKFAESAYHNLIKNNVAELEVEYDIWGDDPTPSKTVTFDEISKSTLKKICEDFDLDIFIRKEDVLVKCDSQLPKEIELIDEVIAQNEGDPKERIKRDEDELEGSGSEGLPEENIPEISGKESPNNETENTADKANNPELPISENTDTNNNTEAPPPEDDQNEEKEKQPETTPTSDTQDNTTPESNINKEENNTITELNPPETEAPLVENEHNANPIAEEENTTQAKEVENNTTIEATLPENEEIPAENKPNSVSSVPDAPNTEVDDGKTIVNSSQENLPQEAANDKPKKFKKGKSLLPISDEVEEVDLNIEPGKQNPAKKTETELGRSLPKVSSSLGKPEEIGKNESRSEPQKEEVEEPKSGETMKAEKDSSILIFLFVGVVCVGAAAFGYNFIKKRKRNNADLARAEEGAANKRNLERKIQSEASEQEMKPLVSKKANAEQQNGSENKTENTVKPNEANGTGSNEETQTANKEQTANKDENKLDTREEK